MPQFTVIGQVKARPGKVEFVKAQLEKLIPITRQERGCIQYDLHQNNEDPAHFLFYENWNLVNCGRII